MLSVIDGSLTPCDIAIVGDRIVGTHGTYEGLRKIDAAGRIAVPGFIDMHLHVESSLVIPHEFDRCVLPHGVTTAICDPHEIANVLGAEGIRYFLASAEAVVMDLRVQLSSCVPATTFETSGARLEIGDLLPFADHPKVIGLAEFMNFPGVLASNENVLVKLAAFQEGHIDGHAPLVTGFDLNGYLAARIRTDHEATTAREAREKLAKGVSILISRRLGLQGSGGAQERRGCEHVFVHGALCTDDRNPLDIAEEGHLDHMICRLIADLKTRGVPFHHAYRVASWSAATAFGLRNRDLLAPGWRADVVLLDDVEHCKVHSVVAGGRPVERSLFAARKPVEPVGLSSMKANPVTADSFPVVAHNAPHPGDRGEGGPDPQRASQDEPAGARRGDLHKYRPGCD
ncbi:amidohydrolase family protein [Breoghania sp.]|uniref:amidohydrolase family protein n=1 Tax=Breoghania sp. TaxID=2065378 RepID=UPI002628E178|nr:amidohydrolase family protein [Breoghania sp.]MDJ0930050.1 amidohydrolase family protein [Breoghania sp.]